MDACQQIALVERYFAAVDAQDLQEVLSTLSHDCVFTVETHRVGLRGHAEISGMFRRLWAQHRSVSHGAFVHVPDPAAGRIASRFKVVNVALDGREHHKSNCNFFEVAGGKFTRVAVYMAGENTLDREDTAD